jgi:hypothetical protein
MMLWPLRPCIWPEKFHCRKFWLITRNGISPCSRPSLHVPVMQYIMFLWYCFQMHACMGDESAWANVFEAQLCWWGGPAVSALSGPWKDRCRGWQWSVQELELQKAWSQACKFSLFMQLVGVPALNACARHHTIATLFPIMNSRLIFFEQGSNLEFSEPAGVRVHPNFVVH